MKSLFISFLISILSFSMAFSQASIKDSSIVVPNFKLGAGLGVPQKDLKIMMGNSSIIHTKFEVKLKSQWIVGAHYNFMFGNSVKDSGMLQELITEGGGIINANGQFGTFQLLQRGHHAGIHAGRLFSILAPNKNSGFVVTMGAGIFSYRVNFNNISSDILQLSGGLQKGYDRYTAGYSLTEFVGYQLFSNNRLLNFYAGVEFTQAFTKIRRAYQVDFEINDPRFGRRNDQLISFQFGWILPLYKRPPKEFYY